MTKPPTITVASGLFISAPTPFDINMGINPNVDVMAVINTGLKCEVALSKMKE